MGQYVVNSIAYICWEEYVQTTTQYKYALFKIMYLIKLISLGMMKKLKVINYMDVVLHVCIFPIASKKPFSQMHVF